MSRRRKIILSFAAATTAIVALIGYQMISTARQLPDAYAAWDTGTLIVEYLKANDDRWPSSWDDLLGLVDSQNGSEIQLYGATAGNVEYVRSLQSRVAIDWQFDYSQSPTDSPVTRLDGTPFPVLWQNADPNQMIRDYFASRDAQSDH